MNTDSALAWFMFGFFTDEFVRYIQNLYLKKKNNKGD